MVFSSLVFLFVYLPVVLAVYWLVPVRFRNGWLFFVNLIFYGWGEPVYILLMLFTITVNYLSGRGIAKYRTENLVRAKAILAINSVISLSLLVFFKYFDLFARTISQIPGLYVPALGLTLPIGISFYTFQCMSYPIDVFRGDTDVQKSYIRFGTYVALFPQLIAGPIVRYKDIADQLEKRPYTLESFALGVERFTVGLAKKVLIANNIGALWDYYASAGTRTTAGAWLGAIAFSLQLYFDFSGYSDMAIGLGHMLGFTFLENFNYPYISRSVTEFWRRWHISLGTWFRDYLYIPLGGNRKGLPRQVWNILIVWALTGFWHGANWTFLLWGLYYAFFLIMEKLFLFKPLQRIPVLGHIYTLLVAVSGWMLFQLDSVRKVIDYWKAMYGFGGAGFLSKTDLFMGRSYLLVLLVAILASTPLLKNLYHKIPEKVRRVSTPILILLVLITSTAYLVDATYNPFLYFRF
ncbi:MAG: MBOAT family protein [Oscillospiraceae bacterium]|nr:MBOAT family protein [Oscillospiraceae bacterium]